MKKVLFVLVMFLVLFLPFGSMGFAFDYTEDDLTYPLTQLEYDSKKSEILSNYPYMVEGIMTVSSGSRLINFIYSENEIVMDGSSFTSEGEIFRSFYNDRGWRLESFTDYVDFSTYGMVFEKKNSFSGEGGEGSPGDDDSNDTGWWDTITSLDNLRDTVGGWINTALSPLILPLEWIGDAMQSMGEHIGNRLEEVKDEIQPFKDFFTSIVDTLNNLVGWINPLSEDFFLRVAFVPSEEYMETYVNNFEGLMHTKFAFLFQLKDTFEAVAETIKAQGSTWDGITVAFPQYDIDEIEIVNSHAIQMYGEKIRFWIGGLMYFLLGTWLIRRLSGLLGEGR